jgi:hypothetical protein
MQQDSSSNDEGSKKFMHPYEDVKNTCVGTDELELLMLEDQQNIDSLSSHNSTY